MNELKQVLFSRFGKRHLHLVKLIGSLLIIIGVLQVIGSLAYMSDSWDAVKNFGNCTPEDASPCAEVLYRITGTSVWAGQNSLEMTQTLGILIKPVTNFFWWLIVLIIGTLLYNVGRATPRLEKEINKRKR